MSDQNNKLSVIEYLEWLIRTFVLDGEPWFSVIDVCKVLGIANPSDAVKGLDDDEKMTIDNPGAGQGRAATLGVVNESGLYHFIIRSRKPEAKAFRKWITSEVLPSIRKTGGYGKNSLEGAEERLVALMAVTFREAFKPMMAWMQTLPQTLAAHQSASTSVKAEQETKWFYGELRELGMLLESLGAGEYTAKQIFDQAYAIGIFKRIFKDTKPNGAKMRLCKKLRRFDGQIVNGLCFEIRGKGNQRRYMITVTIEVERVAQ